MTQRMGKVLTGLRIMTKNYKQTATHNRDMSDKRIRVLPLNTDARAKEVMLVH